MRDFVVWEPGQVLICALCNRERGGDDPPGNWQRHYGSARRRVPIFGGSEIGMPDQILGYLVYVKL